MTPPAIEVASPATRPSFRPVRFCTACRTRVSYDSAVMANIALHEFIGLNRDELIGRCRAKVAKRAAPPSTEAEIDHGVPLFLDQLVVELRDGPSKTAEITKG